MRFASRSVAGLLIVSAMLAGCGRSEASPIATSTSPITQSPTVPPTSPSAPPPSTASGTFTIDDAAGSSVVLPWGPPFDPRPLATFGSRAYFLELISGKDAVTGDLEVPFVYRLHLADVSTGSSSDVLTLAPGHMISSDGSGGTSSFAGFVATADRLYWVEIWYDGLPNLQDVGGNPFGDLPQHWEIVAFDPASGSSSIVASGINRRMAVGEAGATINPPTLAVDGDRLAYTLEAATTDAPNGNKIIVQSLAGGTIIGTMTTNGYVPWVGLAGTVVAYREALGTDLHGSNARDARLMLRTLTADAGVLGAVDDHVATAAITGDRLIWGRNDATDGSAWTALLSDTVPVRIAGPSGVGFKSGSEPGDVQVSASAGFAAWGAAGTVNGSDQSFIPFLWVVGDPSARLIVPSSMGTVTVSDGWMTWIDNAEPPRLHGLPLGAIPPPAP